MQSRSRMLPIVLAAVGVLFLPSTTLAGPKDAAVSKFTSAANADYVAQRFAEAAKKLRGALAACGANGCSPQVKAKVHRDLGVVLIAGLKRVAEGKKEFAEAVKSDPSVALEPGSNSPAVEKAFQAAGGGSAAGAPAAGAPPAGAPPAADNGGGIEHTPPIGQAVLTPLPIYAELPQGIPATKVLVLYKAFGTTDWQKLELKKMGNGYGGEIPCQAIGSTTGDLAYYIQANDAEGDILATNGSRKAPNRVPILNEIAGEPPHLPGRPPPARCRDKADCPPGFPGCTSASTSAKSCETASDCGTGEKCNAAKTCEPESSGKKRFWISAHVQQDLSLVPAQGNVCGNPTTDIPPNFTCFAEDGLEYLGRPEPTDPDVGTGNEIKGGLRRSTTRLLVDFSYLILNNVTIGTRLGYVLSTAPDRPSAKFHVEGRVAYWFGSDPFAKQTIRPYVAVMGGVAEVDDKFSVQIYETLCRTDAECATDANRRLGLARNPTLTAWRRGAKNFAGGSVGVMIPTTQNQGVLAEVKAQTFFPTTGFTISPTVGYALGF